MKIGVTGAGGKLGGNILSHLLARAGASDVVASDIVAITRQPDKLESFRKQGIRVCAGDFNAPQELPNAFEGIDRLLVIPTSDLMPSVRVRQHSAAINAAIDAKVKQIVYISSIGCRPGHGNLENDGILETHWATERVLIDSGAVWTLLRMGPYADSVLPDAAKKAVATGVHSAMAGAPAALVVRDDIAAAAAGILTSDGHEGATYNATGPVSITQQQIAEIIAEISRTPVRFEALTLKQQEANLAAAGLPPFVAAIILKFQLAHRDGAFDLVSGDIGRLSGKSAESPTDFLTRNKQAFL
jgi:NAD(P)H dehydrogenase (quinone)